MREMFAVWLQIKQVPVASLATDNDRPAAVNKQATLQIEYVRFTCAPTSFETGYQLRDKELPTYNYSH
jgi:hypothetical protein